MKALRDVSGHVPPAWTAYLNQHRHRGAEWVEGAYARGIENARRWAEQHYHALRPGVREQVDLCVRLLEYPVLREEAMNRLLWIIHSTRQHAKADRTPVERDHISDE